MSEQIYSLIPKAMQMVGAIGKDSYNQSQKFKYRGIDAVYNALNPVMAELGLFTVPEVLEQTREERKTMNGGNLIYSILKVKFTMYAPDGSSVSGIVTGEGMDSGDKASNKAMSVALKYFCFEVFMIPTEEMVDPDGESHETAPGSKAPDKPKGTQQERIGTPKNTPASADVSKVNGVPAPAQNAPKTTGNPVLDYLAAQRDELRVARRISKAENNALWNKQISVLVANGIIDNKAFSEFTMDEAVALVNYMYSLFDPTGTELKPYDGQTA